MNKIYTVEEEGETVAIYSHTAYQSELSHLQRNTVNIVEHVGCLLIFPCRHYIFISLSMFIRFRIIHTFWLEFHKVVHILYKVCYIRIVRQCLIAYGYYPHLSIWLTYPKVMKVHVGTSVLNTMWHVTWLWYIVCSRVCHEVVWKSYITHVK